MRFHYRGWGRGRRIRGIIRGDGVNEVVFFEVQDDAKCGVSRGLSEVSTHEGLYNSSMPYIV